MKQLFIIQVENKKTQLINVLMLGMLILGQLSINLIIMKTKILYLNLKIKTTQFTRCLKLVADKNTQKFKNLRNKTKQLQQTIMVYL